MAPLVKYVPIILLRVDIQGILMLWREENGGGTQVTISLGTRLLENQRRRSSSVVEVYTAPRMQVVCDGF